VIVNCQELRRAIGADPNHASPESLAHRAECPACEKYAQEMLSMNGLIKRALEIPVPQKSNVVPLPRNDRRPRSRLFAMAASILVTFAIALSAVWFIGYPRESLASAVVGHLAHEPDALTTTDVRVSSELLDGALRAKGMHLLAPLNDISYLQSCTLRGDLVPHLVVQTDKGPVTVLLLTHETVSTPRHFEEEQYHGVLVPMTRGTMAVISSDASVVDVVANRIKNAIAWD
jgi:hypothetical protein